MLKHTKPLADVLTFARVMLAVYIAALGWAEGRSALAIVVLVVVLSWLTDLLDGPLARHDRTAPTTWVGVHDAEVDLSTSLGLTVYLVLSGYLPAWLGATLALTTLLLWPFRAHEFAWLTYVAPYVLVLWAAFEEAPAFGWLAVAFLAMNLLLQWRRLVYDSLPRLFGAIASLYESQRCAHKPGDYTAR